MDSDPTTGVASGHFGFTITGGTSGSSNPAYPGLTRRFHRFHMP